jgi:hypothetical protein
MHSNSAAETPSKEVAFVDLILVLVNFFGKAGW